MISPGGGQLQYVKQTPPRLSETKPAKKCPERHGPIL